MGRQRGRGTIQKTATGWEARLHIPPDPIRGLPGRRVTRRGRTQEEAQQALRDLREVVSTRKGADTLRTSNIQTVDEFWTRWEAVLAAEVANGDIREGHADDCLRRVRHYLLPVAGSHRISSLRPSDVAGVMATMHTKGLAQNTRRAVALAIKKFLVAGVEDGVVPEWVPGAIKVPKMAQTAVRSAPDPTQFSAVLARLFEDTHPAAILVLMAAGTGARRSEVCGARWADVDLAAGSWTIRTSLTWTKAGRHEHGPKNGENRVVPLPDFVLAALKTARRAHPFQTWVSEYPGAPGEPVHANAVSAFYRKLAAEVGAPIGMHSLRRYVVTRLLDVTNGDLDAVAALVGHKSVEILRRHYVVRRDERMAAAMSSAFSGLGC